MKSSSSHEKQWDAFANIAQLETASRSKLLIRPGPPELPPRTIPRGSPRTSFPKPAHCSKPELLRELDALRSRMRPFLENHAPPLPPTRTRLGIEEFQWRLQTEEDRADEVRVFGGAGAWQTVRIPHYSGPIGRATTYYRTVFDAPAELLAHPTVWLRFQGVDYRARVVLNGACVGQHEGFFAPFEFEIKERLRPAGNVLVVVVENDAVAMGNNPWGQNETGDKIYAATHMGWDDPQLGWHHCPPGMGIWQPVLLEGRSELHIRSMFVRPLEDLESAEAWIDVFSTRREDVPVSLELSVHGRNFPARIVESMRTEDLPMAGPWINNYRLNLRLPGVRLWSPEEPWLCLLQARLLDNKGGLLDAAEQQFGMRRFEISETSEPKGRLFLNGTQIRLRGANTMGFEQVAVARGDLHRLADDILLARLANMNFLRITQRPVQEEVYDLCDRLGMMIQTDLPLFAEARRPQFCEMIRQAAEMERLTRAHPCCILSSFINEPLPDSQLRPHRSLLRHELESLFEAAAAAMRIENPDRQIKPVDGDYYPPAPGLPDNHIYSAWYNGHAVEIGLLHRGYWREVKPGWMLGCGEFGAEGLEDFAVMKKYYPPDWMPGLGEDDTQWTPSSIVRSQTASFHQMFYERPRTVRDWIADSQRHQAWAASVQTRAMRRNHLLNSCAIHLFIDAWPSGWMKSIMDCDRNPKPAYFAYREALAPLLVDLRTDRTRGFSGEEISVELWVANDTPWEAPGCTVLWQWETEAGGVIDAGETAATLPACEPAFVGHVRPKTTTVSRRSRFCLRAALLDSSGTCQSTHAIGIEIFPQPEPFSSAPSLLTHDGPAAALLTALGIPTSDDAPVLLADRLESGSVPDNWLDRVRNGARLVLLNLPVGSFRAGDIAFEIEEVGMFPRIFASRDTAHPLVKGFEPQDFRWWYHPGEDCVKPMVPTTFADCPPWKPILRTCQGGWGRQMVPSLAAGSLDYGRGEILVCLLSLAPFASHNPPANEFARRILMPASGMTKS